jgi:murein L,D-transpeptidase YcbB/YkuD
MNLRKQCAVVAALLIAFHLRAPAANASPAAAQIQSLALQAAQAGRQVPRPYDERDWLNRFYAPVGYEPVWKNGSAKAAIAALQDATLHGLSPAEYDADALARQLNDVNASSSAQLDIALTSAMLHYLADLRVGRVRSEYHTTLPDPRLKAFDPVERLRQALQEKRLAAAIEEAEPAMPLYKRVRGTLAEYRALARKPHVDLPALPARTKIEAGAPYPHAIALHNRLALLGDMDAGAALPQEGRYMPELAAAVKRFQLRHGLTSDGILGRGTIAALNVPLSQRVRQLELTLERLRWLPDFAPGPIIAVNLPAYRLWAFDTSTGVGVAEPALEMRVIVGAAVKTQTPLFIGQMRYLEFNPYWNVPRSIERNEIIPKLLRDPAYLEKNDMELVPLSSAVAPASTVDAATLGALQAGKYRVRQRPGPKNALGAVKFAMPNPMNIYLHSTSARELFKLTRRDLSHGCIRVEDPHALAQFVLAGQPEWNAESINAAMEPGPMRKVNLKAPIPVVLFYATAITDREGKAIFAEDIYKRDPALELVLRSHTTLGR